MDYTPKLHDVFFWQRFIFCGASAGTYEEPRKAKVWGVNGRLIAVEFIDDNAGCKIINTSGKDIFVEQETMAKLAMVRAMNNS